MGNITVAVLGTLGYAGNLAKKGTSTDITLYDVKKGEATVTFIEPHATLSASRHYSMPAHWLKKP
jgi:hypothetical protein